MKKALFFPLVLAGVALAASTSFVLAAPGDVTMILRLRSSDARESIEG